MSDEPKRIEDAVISEMLALTEGVTPGPWAISAFNIHRVIAIHEGPAPNGHESTDGRHQHGICEISDGFDAVDFSERRAHASYIAACSPEVIRSLLLEVKAARARNGASLMSNSEDVTLLPCPFCGGEAAIRSTPDRTGWWGVCCACDSMAGTAEDTETEAIAAWNRRVNTSPEPVKKTEGTEQVVAVEVAPLTVKPCKWEMIDLNKEWVASSILGQYRVVKKAACVFAAYTKLSGVDDLLGTYHDEDAAKDACFSDLDTRIRSALRPAPLKTMTVETRARAIHEELAVTPGLSEAFEAYRRSALASPVEPEGTLRRMAFAMWSATTPFGGMSEADFRSRERSEQFRVRELGNDGSTLEHDMLLDWEMNADTFVVLARAAFDALPAPPPSPQVVGE